MRSLPEQNTHVCEEIHQEPGGPPLGNSRGMIFDIDRYAIHDGPGIRVLIFMKGCALRCLWCCNPESQSFLPEVAYFPAKCINCGACVELCPEKAIKLDRGRIVIEWELCKNCGKCVDHCFTDARKLFGRLMSIDELFQEVQKNIVFFRNSGGGVTIGGGEVTGQADFVREFLKRCKKEQVHTAIETCGYCSWENLRTILEYTDLVFYDMKHMDSQKHKKFTGVPNSRILKNLIRVSREPVDLIIRVPVIPDHNDDQGNIRSTVEFIVKELDLSRFKRVELLPYHKLGSFKYDRLGRTYSLKSMDVQSNEKMSFLREIVESYGLPCQVGG
jgi:pyruvate formate lyase activating enzyme